MTDTQELLIAPAGSDRATLEAILTSSSIPFKVEYTYEDGRAELGAVSINIDSRTQPIPGGYSNFGTELVFNHEGKLLAVWSWE